MTKNLPFILVIVITLGLIAYSFTQAFTEVNAKKQYNPSSLNIDRRYDYWQRRDKAPFTPILEQTTVTPTITGAVSSSTTVKTTTSVTPKPSIISPIANLSSSTSTILKKLDEYQQITGGFVTSRMMMFGIMPYDNASAVNYATDIYYELKEFAKYGITPVVISEPVTENDKIDFQKFKNGDYDSFLITYFKTLKNKGITDSQMGIWVPFPEVNIPEWGTTNTGPEDFKSLITHYVTALKTVYPNVKASVLLNAETYVTEASIDGSNLYTSLAPYVTGLTKGLIDSFGLQGFPWMPEAGGSSTDNSLDPAKYLNYKLATDGADALGVKEIWFNTGTFKSMYTNDPSKTVSLTADQRRSILQKALDQLTTAKSKGYTPWINLFNEDKSKVGEAINWSYWSDPTKPDAHTIVIKDFISTLKSKDILLSLFDDKN